MGIPKPPRGKLPLSILATVVCALAFLALLYTESISFFSSSSIFRFKPCPRKYAAKKSSIGNYISLSIFICYANLDEKLLPLTDRRKVDAALRQATDDRFVFDPQECSLNQGKWVFNRTTIKPLYTDTTCPYLDRQVSCVKNGKRDLDYQHWEWEPDDCMLPRSLNRKLFYLIFFC